MNNNLVVTQLMELTSLDTAVQNVENVALKQAISAYITKWSTEIYKAIVDEK